MFEVWQKMGEMIFALILLTGLIWFIKVMYFEKTFIVKSVRFRVSTRDSKCVMVYELFRANFDKKNFPSKKQISNIKETMIESIMKNHEEYESDDFHFDYTIEMEGL